MVTALVLAVEVSGLRVRSARGEVLGQLHGAYRKLIRFHMLRRGASDEEAARGAGISPKATRFFVERARRHRLERLIGRHHHFVEADRRLKTGGRTPQQVLEGLVVALFS